MDTAPRDPDECMDRCAGLVRAALDVVAGKWAAAILFAVAGHPEPVRYGQLRRHLDGITDKELARNLRALEAAGVLARRVHATVPPRVEYRLTGRGATVLPMLKVLADWGARHGQDAARTPWIQRSGARPDPRPAATVRDRSSPHAQPLDPI